MSLINDLFPGISLDKAGYPELENAIESQAEESQLINHPSWRLKLIQVMLDVFSLKFMALVLGKIPLKAYGSVPIRTSYKISESNSSELYE